MTHLTSVQEEKIRSEIMKKPNVVGFSVVTQKRIRDGKEVDEEVIRIYVKRKIRQEVLTPDAVIDAEIQGVKTDVISVGDVIAH